MKTTRLPTLLIVGLVSILPLPGQQGSKKLVEVTKTETIPFSPGGAVHVVHSFGHLAVEGWDRPEVELTVIKSLDGLYDAKDQAEADKRLAAVQVSAERRSDTDLEIVTTVPHRSRLTHPFGSTGGVTLEYQIHVPRNAKLVIQHGAGDVLITNVVADIQATGSSGDIVLLLPATGKYAIDAKSRVGTVSSDFDGDARRRGLAGEQYSITEPGPSHRIYLRMGVGGITIKSS